MTLKLSIKERLLLIPIFPETGKFEKLILKKDIVDKLALKQEDIKKYSIEEIDEKLHWKFVDGSDVEEFDFTDMETNYIKEIFTKQNEAETLHENLLEVYKQLFVK